MNSLLLNKAVELVKLIIADSDTPDRVVTKVTTIYIGLKELDVKKRKN